MERIVLFEDREYLCKYFLDLMFSNQGVDIFHNGFYVGIILYLMIPDENDIEEIEYFDNEVRKFLKEKYCRLI